ncbi:lysylphosphatidylglycerol synthase transmembrane domain-containing protein [Propionivibrio sp.]|uniref:lysylphosphatidylglycerol synthase transmembrane domain-containing protein n=1 Tax=Propionivibrio sp. TaxID=2212460 RepID=UPI00262537FA|nr:lysylphosphatidylglycerol synthase transmembrane domain-containing protein [Propionivibrio sp.]
MTFSALPTFPLRAVFWSVALAALGYLGLSLWAGWREVLAAVVVVGPWVLVGLLSLSLSNYLLRFLRWSRYLALLDAPVAWRINLQVYFSGFALTTSPGKLGELLRSVLLKPHGVPTPASLAAFFAERASDLLSILVLAAVGLLAYAPARPLVGLALAAVVVALLLVQWTALIAAIDHWAARRTQKWARLIVHLCAIVLHFRRCFSLSALAMGLMLGALAWFAEGLGFWWLLGALGHPLPLTTAVFIYAFAMLVGGISFLPGGLGSSEAVMIGLLVINGFPQPVAVSATLICRLATLWFAVALGAIFLARQR